LERIASTRRETGMLKGESTRGKCIKPSAGGKKQHRDLDAEDGFHRRAEQIRSDP
jgi:hypothetical protein